jgi:hypothetical protein
MLTELRHKPPPDVRHYGRVLRTAERVPDYSLFADVEGPTCLRPNEKPTTQSVSPVRQPGSKRYDTCVTGIHPEMISKLRDTPLQARLQATEATGDDEGFNPQVLTIAPRRGDFTAWELPLDVAMAKIEDVNVKNFDDRWSWTNMAWMSQTEKGKKLALELYHSDDSEHFGQATP